MSIALWWNNTQNLLIRSTKGCNGTACFFDMRTKVSPQNIAKDNMSYEGQKNTSAH